MGALQAQEMITHGGIERALVWHLQSNHYPPVPKSMIEPCKEAIRAANREAWEQLIDLPEGVLWKGETKAPAYAIVEAHHLASFLDDDTE